MGFLFYVDLGVMPSYFPLRLATEFSSPEALQKYLKDHPGADKSKHKVDTNQRDKPGRPPKGPEKKPKSEAHGEEPGKGEKKSLKDRIRGLSDKVKKLVADAPEAAKKFLADDHHRRKALQEAHEKLSKAPSNLVKSFVDTLKHEKKEFKEAGAGIKAVLKGGKMDEHQRKAFKTVATHLGITIAATVLTGTGGPLAGAAAIGKAVAKYTAMKGVSRALGHLHVLQELGHINHGVLHVIEKIAADDEGKPDEAVAMTQLIMACVAKEIEDLDDDAITKALKSVDEE